MSELIKLFKILGVKGAILFIGIVGTIFTLKNLMGSLMTNNFDKIFIPKVERKWKEIFNFLGMTVLVNLLLTWYGIVFIKQFQESRILLILYLLSLVIFLLSLILILLRFFMQLYFFKGIIMWLEKNIKKIKVEKNKLKSEKSISKKIIYKLRNYIYIIYKNIDSVIIIMNIYSLAFIYIMNISSYYEKILPLEQFTLSNFKNFDFLFVTFIAFLVIVIFTLLIGYIYKWCLEGLGIKKYNKSKYILKKIDVNNIEDLYFLYSLDKYQFVLGDNYCIEKSNYIYLYNQNLDKCLQFKKTKY